MGKREVTEVGGHRVRMKDESQWIKIPNHHLAIISRELFEQVQTQRPRFKCPKKNDRAYPLRGKVFCGCCRHAMPWRAKKSATFYCRYTGVDETAACHGLLISAAEFEGLLYEILSKQAQISLNLDKDICGDWNCSFGDNYYFTHLIRDCLFQTLSKNKIRLLTASQAQCIDHIAIFERFFRWCRNAYRGMEP